MTQRRSTPSRGRPRDARFIPEVLELESRSCPSATPGLSFLPWDASLADDLGLKEILGAGTAQITPASSAGAAAGLATPAATADGAAAAPAPDLGHAPKATDPPLSLLNEPVAKPAASAAATAVPAKPVPGTHAHPGLQGTFVQMNTNSSLAQMTLDPAVTGVALSVHWDDVQLCQNIYDWSAVDARIQEAQARGLSVSLLFNNSPLHTPLFVLDNPQVQKIGLMDTATTRGTMGQVLTGPVFWDPTYVAARVNFMQAAGARYAGNSSVVGVNVGVADWYTDDWAIPHYTGTLHLPDGTQADLDQVQQWLDAGYSFSGMMKVARTLIDAAAAAFPNQAIKLPVGDDDPGLNGTSTHLAQAVAAYGYANYGDRFFIQLNSLSASTLYATDPAVAAAGPNDHARVFQMLNAYAPQVGFQLLSGASAAVNGNYRLNAGQPGAAEQTLQTAVNVALSYRPAFLEVWSVDATNPALDTGFPALGTGRGPLVADGAGAGGGPEVKLTFAGTGSLQADFMAYDPGFHGGVRTAMGDVTGTGTPSVVTAPGPGGGPDVRVFDTAGTLQREIMAFDPNFLGGLYVAVGDFDGDGVGDVVVGAGAGGEPEVKVFSGKDGRLLADFYAYDPRFRGGVRVAMGDVNGDGKADVITAPGPGGGPDVRVFRGGTATLTDEFLAYDPHFMGGVYVAAGDLNGDGKADIVTGPDTGGGPDVRAFAATGTKLAEVLAYNPTFTGGVRVASTDLNGDGKADILTGAGPGGGPHFQAFDAVTESVCTGYFTFDATFAGGIYPGG